MRISNKVKSILKLVSVLLPNYKFSKPMEGSVYNSIHIDYDFKANGYSHNLCYIGTICLNHKVAVPFKSTDIILRIPTQSPSFKRRILKEWRSIGIILEASKNNSKKDYYQYYKIELNDDGN